MPELPEVETMRRGISGIVGSCIQEIEWLRCRLKPIATTPARNQFRRHAVGRTIRAVDRVGKRVVIRLDNRQSLVLEPRMTGLVLVADPPDRAHLRLRIGLLRSPFPNLWYWDRRGLGSVRIYSAAALGEALGPSKIGPDALSIERDALVKRFGKSRREIKVALLDQRALAGIGNLYASEILFVARIDPRSRCDHLRSQDWLRLHKALVTVLREAIDYEGSTLSDGSYRNALNQAGRYQQHHRVYGRSGRQCGRCQTTQIERIVQAQRSTFYCPKCQARSR